jgi:hypothetical protein
MSTVASGVIVTVNANGLIYPPKFFSAWPAPTPPASPVPSATWPNPVSSSPLTINELTALTEYPGPGFAEVIFQVYQTSKIIVGLPGSGLVAFFDHIYAGQGFERFIKNFAPPFVLPANDSLTIFVGCYSSTYGANLWLTYT